MLTAFVLSVNTLLHPMINDPNLIIDMGHLIFNFLSQY